MLLSLAASLASSKLYIGLTSESMLGKKANKECMQSWATRREGILEFLALLYPKLYVDISILKDPVGVAGTSTDMDALVLTTETLAGGKMVAEARNKNHVPPVPEVVLGFGSLPVASKISSTEIRSCLMRKLAADPVGMLSAWREVTLGAKISTEIAAGWWDRLRDCYAEDWRFYHNLAHIRHVLEVLAGEKVKNLTALKLAAWFHDAIYYPTSGKNEEMSAELFVRFANDCAAAGCPLDPVVAEMTKKCILATEKHAVPEGLAESQADDVRLFLDADLAILGVEQKDRYLGYASNIRKEYAHVPSEQYRKGRAAVLNTFLHRPQIYFSPVLREKLESCARSNLQSEMDSLSSA